MNRHCRNSICNGNFNSHILSNQNSNCCDHILTNNCNQEDNCANDNLHETLCRCIGLQCSCEFQIHDNLETKTGILEKVGEDHIILRSINHNKLMLCDICNLRFITVNC